MPSDRFISRFFISSRPQYNNCNEELKVVIDSEVGSWNYTDCKPCMMMMERIKEGSCNV
jgi:hypothetical protein